MAGMWELPEVSGGAPGAKARSNGAGKIAALKALRHPKARSDDHADASFTLKHSITVTDYTVRVWRVAAASQDGGKWIPAESLSRVALTGLARKILRKAEISPPHPKGRLRHLTVGAVWQVYALAATHFARTNGRTIDGGIDHWGEGTGI